MVATTSGTAAVELHPAVVEASHAGVPLIAATADRPPELHGVGAPQTVDQDGLFGPSPRWAVSPGWPSGRRRQLALAGGPLGGVARAGRAARAGSPQPGLPRAAARTGPAAPTAAVAVARRGGPTGPLAPTARRRRPVRRRRRWSTLLAAHAGGRGLIVAGAGAGDPATLRRGGPGLGWPLLADPRSGCRVPARRWWRPPTPCCGPGGGGVATRRGAAIGAPWASKVLTQWLAGLGPEVPQVLVDPWGRWADPGPPGRAGGRRRSPALAAALAGGHGPVRAG